MRILITGAAGMLGRDAIVGLSGVGHEVVGVDNRADGELTRADITDLDDMLRLVERVRPDLVVHCAAFTNVDQCEREPETAYRVNAFGTGCVAAAAESVGAALVAISTDFVFDGEKGAPYTEFDTPNPISHYGGSKRAGEILARQNCRRCYIVRTSWLYGVHGNNFPYTMIRLAQSRPELTVVADQIGTPTYTVDLVAAIAEIVQRPLYGVYHVSNAGQTSWRAFAEEVLRRTGHAETKVLPLTSDEYAEMSKSPTRRPRASVLRHLALEMQGRDNLRPWQDALADFLAAARAAGTI